MTIKRIEEIFEEFGVQKVDYAHFSYDIKNMQVMVEGYWSTDCVSINLTMSSFNFKNEEELKDVLRSSIKTISFSDLSKSLITNFGPGGETYTIRMCCISTDLRNSRLETAKNKIQQTNVTYIYSPSAPSSKL